MQFDHNQSGHPCCGAGIFFKQSVELLVITSQGILLVLGSLLIFIYYYYYFNQSVDQFGRN